MEDVRLKTAHFEFQGRVYELRCNFNVLAEIEAEAGSLRSFLRLSTMKSVLIALAAMLNDYADDMGWEERISSKELGRVLATERRKIKQVSNMVVELVLDALRSPAAADGGVEKN